MTDALKGDTPSTASRKKSSSRPQAKPPENAKKSVTQQTVAIEETAAKPKGRGKAQPKNTTETKAKTADNRSIQTTKKNVEKGTSPKSEFATADGKGPKLKVIPLGGLGEVGKNMTVIQYGNQILVVDGGVIFPEDELLGIDLVVPDYTYLLENREMVKAFLITHGHEDHIGGLPYILNDFSTVPVYGSRLTLGLLKGQLQERRVSANLQEIQPRAKIKIGPFTVEPIRVTHSIPDSLAYAIHTPVGTVLMISDFKMDMSPIDGQFMDFGTLSRIGEKGVLLLMMDSTNAEREGFTPSEKTVGFTVDKVFLTAPGRVIITTFASNVHRIQQAVWAAVKSRRKIAIVGRGMLNVTAIATEMGYLDIPAGALVDVDQINTLPANEVLILTTGSQGEPLSGLTRMAAGEHRHVHILPGDVVVISATPIPGNEKLVGRTIDNLFRQGANVIYERSAGIHVSGHASREELKLLINMIKPKYFMPVHGEYRMLYKHALLAQQLGIPAKNTFVMENGQVLEVSPRRCRIANSVTAGRILIDGLGVGDVGNTVLKERKLLSEGGVVVVNIIVNKKTGKILYGPEVVTRGFIFEKESEHIIDEAKNKVNSICTKNSENGSTDWNGVRGQIRSNLSRFLFDRIGRRPIVLPVITEL